MGAASWPLWRGGEVQFWTDYRGWSVDRVGPHADWADMIAHGLPSLGAAHAAARQYLAENGLRRVEVVSEGGER
jgi:hypothetical protein